MSDLSLFYSSMSNVLTQWNDLSANRGLYKAYFQMQSEDSKKTGGSNESYIQKFINSSTEKLSANNDKLNSYSTKVSDSVKKLEEAFEANKETGEKDTEKAYGAASDFVKSYNDLTSAIKNSGNSTVSNKAQFISNMTNAYNYKLQKVGITTGADGSLSIDKEKFETANEKDIETVFGKKDSFASFIDSQSKQLAAYAQTDAYQQASAYNNAGNIMNISNISGSYLNMLG